MKNKRFYLILIAVLLILALAVFLIFRHGSQPAIPSDSDSQSELPIDPEDSEVPAIIPSTIDTEDDPPTSLSYEDIGNEAHRILRAAASLAPNWDNGVFALTELATDNPFFVVLNTAEQNPGLKNFFQYISQSVSYEVVSIEEMSKNNAFRVSFDIRYPVIEKAINELGREYGQKELELYGSGMAEALMQIDLEQLPSNTETVSYGFFAKDDILYLFAPIDTDPFYPFWCGLRILAVGEDDFLISNNMSGLYKIESAEFLAAHANHAAILEFMQGTLDAIKMADYGALEDLSLNGPSRAYSLYTSAFATDLRNTFEAAEDDDELAHRITELVDDAGIEFSYFIAESGLEDEDPVEYAIQIDYHYQSVAGSRQISWPHSPAAFGMGSEADEICSGLAQILWDILQNVQSVY